MAQVKSGSALEEKIAKVRDSYEAYERGDYAAAKEGYTEDAVFHSQLRERDFKGRDAMFREADAQRTEFKAEYRVHDICAGDGHAVVLMEVTQEVDGQRKSGRLVHVLHLDDAGKIKEVWAVFNPQG